MANDDQGGSELSEREEQAKQPKGTANLLNNYSDFAAIKDEYDDDVAAGLLSKSLERQGVEATKDGVKTWFEVSDAMVKKDVSVGQEYQDAKAKTDAVVDKHFSVMTRPESEPETSQEPEHLSGAERGHGSEDEDFDDDDLAIEGQAPELDDLQDIFGCDSREEAEEQAADYVYKLNDL